MPGKFAIIIACCLSAIFWISITAANPVSAQENGVTRTDAANLPAIRISPAAPASPQQPLSTNEIFLRTEMTPASPIAGEQITVRYRLYSVWPVVGVTIERKPRGVGLTGEELFAPRQPRFREVSLNESVYQSAVVYTAAMFADAPGRASIAPMEIVCRTEVPSSSGMPFDRLTTRSTEIRVSSEPVELEARPLPAEGRPEEFTGAVGQFSISAQLDTPYAAAENPVVFRMVVEGSGNIHQLEAPAPRFPPGLVVSERRPAFETDPFRDEITGTLTRKFELLSLQGGTFHIPPATLHFFDPLTATWRAAVSQPVTLTVANAVRSETKESFKGDRELMSAIPDDIHPIRTEPMQSSGRRNPLFPWIVAFLVAGAVLHLVPFAASIAGRKSGSAKPLSSRFCK